jgi:hypothetical protein
MIARWIMVLLAAWCSDARGQSASRDGGLDRAVALTRESRYVQALAAADATASALDRAQARVYVLHQAGDLSGALAAGQAGLRSSPRDLWLLERVCYIAISLRGTLVAEEHLARLAEAVDAADLQGPERDRWLGTVSIYRSQVTALQDVARGAAAAGTRARATAIAGLVLAILLLCSLASTGSDAK